jgi:hypothetical protein
VGLVDGLLAGDPGQIGPFRLLGRLGEGGMGRVYLGESPGGRKVAIKVVHPHYASDPGFRSRFAREVAAARQVGGFHTAGVVGADPGADPPWMATAYIPGPSLAEAVAGGGPLDEAGVRRLGAALAEGLAAIHECGLIHRDLKPGNVTMADGGPRIIDFGVAKGADATALTGSSAVIGTLRYMSPEQLNGLELTPQSDVFALGTVLAFAATGRDPFEAPTIPAVITRILTGAPGLDPLTGDLRGVIAGCLAKDPGSRPSTGELLARFGRPVPHDPTVTAAPAAARVPGPLPAAQEPSFLSTVDVSPVVALGRTDPPAAQADLPAAVLRPTRKPARLGSRRTGLIAVGAAAVLVAAGILFFFVNGSPSAPSLTAIAALTDPSSQGFDSINSVAFGPGGVLATGDYDGNTYLWNTTTDTIIAKLADPVSPEGKTFDSVNSVAFGPGGILAVGAGGGGVGVTYLWNTTTDKITATLTNTAGGGVQSVAFGPGGILATADFDGRTYLWNTITDKITATLTDPASKLVNSVAFGPGGILATGDGNGSTYLWNTATREITATLTEPVGNEVDAAHTVSSVAFGPDGTLATNDNYSTYLWNTHTDKITATFTDSRSTSLGSVAFGPGGILAAAAGSGSTDLWNTTTGTITATLADNAGQSLQGLQPVAFGPDGLLAAGQDGSIYLWHVADG